MKDRYFRTAGICLKYLSTGDQPYSSPIKIPCLYRIVHLKVIKKETHYGQPYATGGL
jgi:hypothetical protein